MIKTQKIFNSVHYVVDKPNEEQKVVDKIIRWASPPIVWNWWKLVLLPLALLWDWSREGLKQQ
jgi:hypothetical protein